MGPAAVAAVRYSVRTDRCSGPGSPVHSWAFPGSDCKLAFDWGLRVDMAWSYWHCKCFETELGDTGRWVGEEWVVVVGEGVSLRWLDSGGVGEWQGEGAVVEVDRRGTGLPFQALEGAMEKKEKKKKKNGDESQAFCRRDRPMCHSGKSQSRHHK